MSSKSVRTVEQALRSYASADKAKRYARFFKTGKGQYGEGDRFIGVTVPEVREVAKEYRKSATLEIIDELLASPIHEVRLCALIMLVYKYQQISKLSLREDRSPAKRDPRICTPSMSATASGQSHDKPLLKKNIFDFYLSHTKYINNWDLVDLTAPHIVGDYLLRNCSLTEDTYFAQTTGFSRGVRRKQNTVSRDKLPTILVQFSQSRSLWERRIAILSTFASIRAGRHQEAFAIAELLLHDGHDLIHKAIGWMLREVGKRIGKDTLREFLDKHASTMPRTALRYAIEHMKKEERVKYLHVPHLS